MTRVLRIRWAPGRTVDALLAVPADPVPPAVLLAHGAGAGQRSPFMEHMRRGLAAAGHMAMTFDYPYTADGRGRPDRLSVLVGAHGAASDRLAGYGAPVALAGKSMGGRVGSHLAAEDGTGVAALVYYGYPLVPMGKGEPRDTSHLERISAPQLFFTGTRDRLSPPGPVTRLAAGLAAATAVVVDDADHSFRVRAGRDHGDVLDDLVRQTVAWLSQSAVGEGGT